MVIWSIVTDMKKPAHRGDITLIAIIVIVLTVGGLLFLKDNSTQTKNAQNLPSQSTDSAKPKTFKSSSVMKFSIELSNDFTATEGAGSVTVSAKKGEILILQNGTNFGSIDDYISNSRNDIGNRIKKKEKFNTLNLEVITGLLDNERIYFIMPENSYTIYILSTKNEELFQILDQIARSFRYTP